jgi:PKD repeat protein
VSPIAGATILRGETYAAAGSFADADPDTWTATVDYGAGTQALALNGKTFSLSHTYAAAGTFTVTVAVSDNDGGTGNRTATVIVWSAQQGIAALAQQAGAPQHPLTNAADAVSRGDKGAASNQMEAFINQVQAQVSAGRMTAARGAELTAFANRIIGSING